MSKFSGKRQRPQWHHRRRTWIQSRELVTEVPNVFIKRRKSKNWKVSFSYAFSSPFIRNHQKSCSTSVIFPAARGSLSMGSVPAAVDCLYVTELAGGIGFRNSILPRTACLQKKYLHNTAIPLSKKVILATGEGRVNPTSAKAFASCQQRAEGLQPKPGRQQAQRRLLAARPAARHRAGARLSAWARLLGLRSCPWSCYQNLISFFNRQTFLQVLSVSGITMTWLATRKNAWPLRQAMHKHGALPQAAHNSTREWDLQAGVTNKHMDTKQIVATGNAV